MENTAEDSSTRAAGMIIGFFIACLQSWYYAFSWAATVQQKFVPGAGPEWYDQWNTQMNEGYRLLIEGGMVEHAATYSLYGGLTFILLYMLWFKTPRYGNENTSAESEA